jgi:HAE1 family hydrophobic/amphiphilic exporter-1
LLKKTFLPQFDAGEFLIAFELPPGSSLQATENVSKQIFDILTKHKEVEQVYIVLGTETGESNKANIGVRLVPLANRNIKTEDFKKKC